MFWNNVEANILKEEVATISKYTASTAFLEALQKGEYSFEDVSIGVPIVIIEKPPISFGGFLIV